MLQTLAVPSGGLIDTLLVKTFTVLVGSLSFEAVLAKLLVLNWALLFGANTIVFQAKIGSLTLLF